MNEYEKADCQNTLFGLARYYDIIHFFESKGCKFFENGKLEIKCSNGNVYRSDDIISFLLNLESLYFNYWEEAEYPYIKKYVTDMVEKYGKSFIPEFLSYNIPIDCCGAIVPILLKIEKNGKYTFYGILRNYEYDEQDYVKGFLHLDESSVKIDFYIPIEEKELKEQIVKSIQDIYNEKIRPPDDVILEASYIVWRDYVGYNVKLLDEVDRCEDNC